MTIRIKNYYLCTGCFRQLLFFLFYPSENKFQYLSDNYLWPVNTLNLDKPKMLSLGKVLTLSQTTNSRLFQTERVCR